MLFAPPVSLAGRAVLGMQQGLHDSYRRKARMNELASKHTTDFQEFLMYLGVKKKEDWVSPSQFFFPYYFISLFHYFIILFICYIINPHIV